MIDSIIVGIDGSDASQRALRMACGIARQFNAKLEVVHTPIDETVTYAADAMSGLYLGAHAAQQDDLDQAAQQLMQKAREIIADEGLAGVETHILKGDPAGNVLDRAEAAAAQLIVTGRRGLGDLGALVLGSTSHQISKNAKCACLTVP
jgi:nucleotide-binding universal stress UspA family protein